MIATNLPAPRSILNCWRQQRRVRHRLGTRDGLVALSYLTCGPVVDGLVDITRLVLVVLTDVPVGDGRIRERLAGYRGACVPWGVAWGGAGSNTFLKDFSRAPQSGATGLRLDLRRKELVTLALELDRLLTRHTDRPHFPKRTQIQLPHVWAAFRPLDAAQLEGDGPEFESACDATGLNAFELFRRSRRQHRGLVLWPLEWVSHSWTTAVTLLADLRSIPKRQVIKSADVGRALRGHCGAAEFDFVTTRFRST